VHPHPALVSVCIVPLCLPAVAILFHYIFGFKKLNKFVIKEAERNLLSLGAFAEFA